MIDVKFHYGWYVVTLPKCVLVLSRDDFIQALRRGKWWRRREALHARKPAGQPPLAPESRARRDGGEGPCRP
jgi:hypothetical protein